MLAFFQSSQASIHNFKPEVNTFDIARITIRVFPSWLLSIRTRSQAVCFPNTVDFIPWGQVVLSQVLPLDLLFLEAPLLPGENDTDALADPS